MGWENETKRNQWDNGVDAIVGQLELRKFEKTNPNGKDGIVGQLNFEGSGTRKQTGYMG